MGVEGVGGGGVEEKVCLFLLPLPAISILLKHTIPQRKYSLVQAHPFSTPPCQPPPSQETVGNAELGIPSSYERLLDVMVPIHHLSMHCIQAQQAQESILDPAPNQLNYIH